MNVLAVANDIAATWYHYKRNLTVTTGVSNDAIHVLIGIPLQLIFAAMLRMSMRDVLPVIALFMLAMGNEWLDWRSGADPDQASRCAEAIKDGILTMALPLLVMLVGRICPGLLWRGGRA